MSSEPEPLSPDEWDALKAEAEAAADADPVARHELAYLDDERIERAAALRRNHDAQIAALPPSALAAHQSNCPLCIARALPVPEPAGPTWRTLADISDDPPGALALGVYEPDGPNLLYAAPGTGKGCTGAWMILELERLGQKVMVYDAEGRPREWARRVSGLGADRSRVVYVQPADLGPKLAGRPLWEVAERLGEVARLSGSDLLMVDSVLPAVGIGEERLKSDAQVPYLYVAALDALGLPSVSFGHPPKGQPEGDPFGSVSWLGAMRLTWLGSRAEGDGHRVRWRPRKRNERGHIPGVLLSFAYGDDGRLCGVTREDDEESTRDWLLAALVSGPRSVADLAEEELADSDEPTTPERRERVKERLNKALRRMAREGWVDRIGTSGPSVRWQLRTDGPTR